MTYVQIAVYAVPTANKDAFIAHARQMAPVFKKHGAIKAVDCWGTDVPPGEVTSLPLAVKAGPDETVCFSYMTFESKAAAEACQTAAMQDFQQMAKDQGGGAMPFDGSRMIFGGFETVVDL